MKLLIENIDPSSLQLITEVIDIGGEKKKVYRLKGPFLGANEKNRNGRIYSESLLIREVRNYNEQFIKNNRAVGTLDHDSTPNINLDRISHVIEQLSMDGNIGYGTAKIIETPCGKIAMNLMDAGVQLGMSTRGVGSINGDMVGEDFQLLSVDIVQMPSCQKAYVESVIEGREWIASGDKFVEAAIDELKKKLDTRADHFGSSKLTLNYLNDFLSAIKNK